MFHLGWFLSYKVQSWRQTWSGAGMTEWVKPGLYVDMANSLERAGFDYIMFEDGSFIPDAYGSSAEYALRTATTAPKHDPMALIAAISGATKNIGLIATMTTTFYPPFLGARLMTTLDHLTDGRVGVNLVTSHNVRTAQNYGLAEQVEHDERYAMANEWIDLVGQLWESWEPGAVVMDEENGVFVDHTKVHPIDLEGKYFRSRGPLNAIPGPQRRPVICQAGGSAPGRDFGAAHADTIIAQVRSVQDMRAYREDISARATAHGRDPESIKVLFLSSYILAESDAEATAKADAADAAQAANIQANLSMMSFSSGIDFTKFDLDAPVPQVETNAGRTSTALHLEGRGEGLTLRDIAAAPPPGIRVVGSPETVAAQMGEVMEEAGGDGFLVLGATHRRFIAEIADGLAPVLRRKGLIRSGYAHPTLRQNLLDF
jgi:FMN-dependent oxidoreductase (nitrilotriacetate monooxygenase family)